jgi:cobalamin-dependent methionine synthase I
MIGLSGLITPSLDEMCPRRLPRWSVEGIDISRC